MAGIVQTLEVLELGLSIGESFAKSLKDGKMDASDIPFFLPPLMLVPAAVEGIGEMVPELKDLDNAEMEQIKNLVISKLGEAMELDNRWLKVAQEAFTLGLSIYRMTMIFVKPV